jgi:single-strand DNA-binding protein
MNAIRNTVQLIGQVGQEPEIKSFEKGKKVANLILTTSDIYYLGMEIKLNKPNGIE